MCLHARGVYTRAARGSKDIPYTGGFKLDPRAGDKEALRDVRGTLMGVFIKRKMVAMGGNLQDSDDDETARAEAREARGAGRQRRAKRLRRRQRAVRRRP